ncbi:uroporphyrinogen decarboxylase/cobalamine-independent methonine synthase family protein [Cumulibacter manganitolerans]|uniref:methionine synthase n=1 Tax=Cumulibacter manganitolerans TaxID=1884992 RepID=UPI001297B836|nr:methionine synthase [Cumulibacter manganitolerans]
MRIGTTGVGSLPGAGAEEAMRVAFGEGLDLPYLAETPARGPGADQIGRTAARLVDVHVEITPSAWRVTRRPGVDARRADDFWAWDLDAVQTTAEGYAGPLKVQLAGPWTLAASLELANGHRFLTDAGAVRDLQESLAEGAVQVLDDLRRRVPGAQPVLQLDEPSLPGVLAGSIPTASGFGRLEAVGAHEAGLGLQRVIEAVGVPVLVHSCAARVPFGLLRQSGAEAVLVDVALLTEAAYDDLGAAVDEGLALVAGVVPSTRAVRRDDVDRGAARVREIASAIGVPAARIADEIGITTACGLASRTAAEALAATRAVRAVHRQLTDNPETDHA